MVGEADTERQQQQAASGSLHYKQGPSINPEGDLTCRRGGRGRARDAWSTEGLVESRLLCTLGYRRQTVNGKQGCNSLAPIVSSCSIACHHSGLGATYQPLWKLRDEGQGSPAVSERSFAPRVSDSHSCVHAAAASARRVRVSRVATKRRVSFWTAHFVPIADG